MTSPSLPDHWRELIAGYVLEDLTADERRQVDQWITQYPDVAAELDALQTTWGDLPHSLALQAPPSHLRGRVLAAVQAPDPAPRSGSSRPWAAISLGAGWAATAVALVAVAIDNQQLRQNLLETEAVVASFSQPDSHLYTLAGTETQPQATGRLLVDPERQTALIVTTDLPPLTPDQTYRLWALGTEDPIFCGQFNPDPAQAAEQWSLPDSACSAGSVQMLITAESVADPPVPAGPLVLQSRS